MKRFVFLALSAVILVPARSEAANVTWTGGNFTWDQPDADSFDAAYVSGDTVFFGDVGVGTITVGSGVTPGGVFFEHSSGTYVLGGTAFNSGNNSLQVTGGGTVQFGNLSNTAFAATWGNTTISGGSTLAYTRGSGFLGSSGSTVNLDNGSLLVTTDNSAILTYNNTVSVGAGGGTILGRVSGSNNSRLNFSGNFTGDASLVLNSYTTATSNAWRGYGLQMSGTNSAYSGDVTITSYRGGTTSEATLPGQFGSAFTTFQNDSAFFSNSNTVTVKNGGVLAVDYAASSSVFAGITFGPRGGLGATGANGTLTSLTDPMSLVGVGGVLVLDNSNALNNNRLGDTSSLTLNNNRLHLIGRNANTSETLEVTGNMTISGGALFTIDRPNGTSSGVKLTVASLTATTAGNSLLIQSQNWGTTATLNNLLVSGSKPTVTNGMITPGIQLYDSGNLVGNFLTFSGNNLVLSTYTDFADNTWAAAGNATLVNVTAATALGSGADVNIHALRIFSGNQDLGGRTVNLGSGGLITTNANTSNGTLNFGSTAAYIGAYNASAQATISAAITASGGLTVLGTSQTLNITGTNTNLTGGIFINGGAVRLSTLGANGNNVTVGAFGRLVAGQTSTPTTDKIGGLSGVGIVSSWVANAGTSEGTLEISPATGTHTFNGSLTNGNGSPRPLAIIKSGNGTQVFGTNSVGSYTGNTTVSEGTLIINGDFSTATGNVHVASGAILGGNGTLGGTTSVTGSLRPGNSLGILTITNSFTWNSGDDWVFELGAANSSDRLILTGSNGEFLKGSGSTFEFDFAGSTTTGNFTLVDWSSTSNLGGGALGTSFQLSDFTYTGLGGGNTGTFSLSGSQLNFTVVPEPATWALLTTCLTVTMVFRKRTSRRRDG